jgi:hypothetical protein
VLLLIGLVLGIVAGSVLAGQLHKVGDLSWTRRYGLFMAVGILLLGFLGGHWGLAIVVAVLVATGFFAGLLIVPLNAALQAESDQSKLGKTVSIQNFFDYSGMAAGAGFLWLDDQAQSVAGDGVRRPGGRDRRHRRGVGHAKIIRDAEVGTPQREETGRDDTARRCTIPFEAHSPYFAPSPE